MQTEENALESALRLAATEPAHRPDFYKALLESTVYVLGHSAQPTDGVRTLEAGEDLSMQNWAKDDGTTFIPFFSSLAALARAIDQEMRYLALPARSFFEITQGNALVLNPRSEYGKEFSPGEVAALLRNGVNRTAEKRVTRKDTQVLVGEPKNYPTQMVASLKTLLATRSNARAAYLLQMHDAANDDKPHLVVGIEADGDIEQLIGEVGAVAADTSRPDEPVDLMHVVRGAHGLSEYFLEHVKPFYQRDLTGH